VSCAVYPFSVARQRIRKQVPSAAKSCWYFRFIRRSCRKKLLLMQGTAWWQKSLSVHTHPYCLTWRHTPGICCHPRLRSPKTQDLVTYLAKKLNHLGPVKRPWNCCFRNVVTCLPKWDGAPSCSGHISWLVSRGTSSDINDSSCCSPKLIH
jgi:hypothetical protein